MSILRTAAYVQCRPKAAAHADKILIDWPWCEGIRPSALRAQFRKDLEHARLLGPRPPGLVTAQPHFIQRSAEWSPGRPARLSPAHSDRALSRSPSPPSPGALCSVEPRPAA